VSRAPFSPLRFDELPERPRVPHRFFDVEAREVVVRSGPFGAVRTHVRVAGRGPPLLLVHGLMTTSYSFRYVVDALAARYRVYVPDLVGCGRTDKPVARYDVASVASFVGDLMEALSITGARVVGNSLGGYVCMRLALDRPAAMTALVNIHSPGMVDLRLRGLAFGLRLPGARAILHRVIARDPLRWAFRNVHYRDETLKSLEEAREYGEPLRTVEGREAFIRYLGDTLAPAGMTALAADLGAGPFPVPLFLLYAREDPMVPPAVGPRLHALVPSARFEWLDAASHFAHVDAPERTVSTVVAFFDSL
jgi:pimeloyl-ACP methyl ester carboxylesterase